MILCNSGAKLNRFNATLTEPIMYKIILFILVLITGCATSVAHDEASLKVLSNPLGATITYDGKTFQAPQTLYFKLTGATATTKLTATWPSGASVTMNVRLVAGQSLHYTMQRPPNTPGLDADMAWALQMHRDTQALEAATQDSLNDAARSIGKALGSLRK
jgi:hypothetical protein